MWIDLIKCTDLIIDLIKCTNLISISSTLSVDTDLGVVLDSQLTMSAHVNSVC